VRRLFDRRGRLIRLNRVGHAFLEAVDRALSQLEDGRRKVADLVGVEGGWLRSLTSRSSA
jgi:LysR family transcriptional regulator, transcription activator of glutamate synthase operon